MAYLNPRQREEVRHLIALMKDPRYWREQDPELLRTVRLGLRRIYRGEGSDAPAPATAGSDAGEFGQAPAAIARTG